MGHATGEKRMVWQAYTLAFYGKRATGALRTIFVFMHQEMLEARDRLDEGRAVKEKIAPVLLGQG